MRTKVNVEDYPVISKLSPELGKYYRNEDGDIYILGRIGYENYSLINIKTGCPWNSTDDIHDVFTAVERWTVIEEITIKVNK